MLIKLQNNYKAFKIQNLPIILEKKRKNKNKNLKNNSNMNNTRCKNNN